MISVCPLHRLHEILPMGERFFNLSGEIGVFNPGHYFDFLVKHYVNRTGCVIIGESNNKIDAALGLVFYNEPLTGDMVATEICWYSEGSNGIKVYKRAKEIAKECGAKVFYSQHLNTPESSSVAKFYSRNGSKLKYLRYAMEL